jgi:hypothetical protein
MRTISIAVAFGVALVSSPFSGAAYASTLLDYVTFDGIDYIRWAEEPGRQLGREDLGPEFAVVECSFGEDLRGCPHGVDASAAFLPAGTRMYAVRGHGTTFRLAAVWRDRIFLYQAWRNPRAKVATDIYDIADEVRGIDVRRAPRGVRRRTRQASPVTGSPSGSAMAPRSAGSISVRRMS